MGSKFSETSFPHFKTYFMQIKCNLYTTILLKKFDSNNFTSVSNVLFPKCVAHKKKSCVYVITFLYIHSFPCENSLDWITTCEFFKTMNLILVNFQAVAGGKKCHLRW